MMGKVKRMHFREKKSVREIVRLREFVAQRGATASRSA
jgi:hypothetical protein